MFTRVDIPFFLQAHGVKECSTWSGKEREYSQLGLL